MTLSMHAAAVPGLEQTISALIRILEKAEAYGAARKIDPAVMLSARLYPDMFPLSRQIQLTSDFAKGAVSRLAGREPPKWEDNESSFAELKARLQRTLDLVRAVKPGDLEGSQTRSIKLTVGGQPITLTGQDYLVNFVLPNFYFHAATAYAILRHNGLDVGKRDFMGRA